MDLKIRVAGFAEYEAVRAFYYDLIDAMAHAKYSPAWEKGIYPTDKYLRDSIDKQELFVCIVDDKIVAAMVINHEFNESYAKVAWPTKASPAETTVIHILGVHPDFSGRGIAKELVAKAVNIAVEKQQKVIRLDVLAGNVPAENLYSGLGFQYVDTVRMYYEDTDWTDFKLYEYQI